MPIRQTRTPPSLAATAGFLVVLLFTWLTAGGATAESVAFQAAVSITIGLGFAIALEVMRGWRNLFRTDILALCALHFLSVFEFLFPQPRINDLLDPATTVDGIHLVILGFTGILIGRHIKLPTSKNLIHLTRQPVSTDVLLKIFWTCAAIGYFYMLYTVSFNPLHMLSEMLDPRFARPWSRGRFGGWNALLYELNRLLYLVPPLAGVIFARRNRYTGPQTFFVGLILLLTLFHGFSSGTRNLFGTYLLTFLVGYAFALPPKAYKKAGLALSLGVFMMGMATKLMLRFREEGLGRFLRQGPDESFFEGRTLFVDFNLYVISELSNKFPGQFDFLGFEVVYLALVRPIPRAIWSGKPKGLTVSIEEAMGVEGLTLATTFIGEAYMSGGAVAVVLFGMFFGIFARWWNAYGSDQSSELGIVIYAAGIFAIVITMRSTLVFTESILSAIAAIVIGRYLLRAPRSRVRAASSRPGS